MRFSYLIVLIAFIPFISLGQRNPVFIENKNQWGHEIDYGLRVAGGNMFIQPGSFSYYFLDQEHIQQIHEQSHHRIDEAGFTESQEKIEGRYILTHFLDEKRISN